MAQFGYICDTNELTALTQLRGMGIPANRIFIDDGIKKISERPEFSRMMRLLKRGDVVFVKSLDQLGISVTEIGNQWKIITLGHGADLVVLDEPLLDTRIASAPASEVALAVISALDRSYYINLRKRQEEGYEISRAKGTHIGRPKQKIPDNFREIVSRWESKEIPFSLALARTGLSATTFYRMLREYRASANENSR